MTSSLVVGLQGALTIAFTPAASCLPLNNLQTITSINNTFFHQYHVHTECQPHTTASPGYFSPAVCPSGYNPALGSLHNILLGELNDKIDSEIQSGISSTRIAVGESVDFCCPVGYDANIMNDCTSVMNDCTSVMKGQTAMVMGVAADVTLTGMVTGTAVADMVQIRFQQTDKLPAPTSYPMLSASSLLSSSIPIPTTSPIPTTVASFVPTPVASPSVDNGAQNRKVIGVACSIIAVIVVLAYVFVVRIFSRHGRKSKGVEIYDDPPPYSLTDDSVGDGRVKQSDEETPTSEFDRINN